MKAALRTGNFLENIVPSDLTRCNSSQTFLQSGLWGSFKARFGWNARSFEVKWAGFSGGKGASGSVLVIRRRLAPGISFAYVPWGPELPPDFPADEDARQKAVLEIAEALRDFLPEDTAFLRFDPPWYAEGASADRPRLEKPFLRSSFDVQPPDTVIVDLEKDAEAILAGMKSKWRYNSRLALKKGVAVSREDEAGLDNFYALLTETAKRDGIAIHSADYYHTLFSHFAAYEAGKSVHAEVRLYAARFEGEVLAANVVLYWEKKAVYLYGASSSGKRNLMAPYALQTRSMLDAKEAGCLEYDLFGIPPSEDPSHPMAGLYRFKTGFGGRIIHRPGSWDYLYKPFPARLFLFAETARKKFRDAKKAGAKEKSRAAEE